jgi:hypothetical protein
MKCRMSGCQKPATRFYTYDLCAGDQIDRMARCEFHFWITFTINREYFDEHNLMKISEAEYEVYEIMES